MALLDYSRTNIKLKQCVYLSKWFLNTGRNKASIIPLVVFYCLTTISVKKFFLMSSLNLLWGSSEPLPHPATRYIEEKSTLSPGWLDHASISFMLSIYAWIVSSASSAFIQACCLFCLTSCMSGRTILKCRGDDPWKSTSSPESPFSLGLYPTKFFQARPWKIQTQNRLVILLTGSWSPISHLAKSAPVHTSDQFLLVCS